MKQDLLTFKNVDHEQINSLLVLASNIKQSPAEYAHKLKGKSVVALFEKPSLRTRVSFDIGINKLGGHLVYLDSQSNNLAGRESIGDMGANLSCWADAVVARVFKHDTLEQLSAASKVPVINALCDLYHPCQGLADYLTLVEHFDDLSKVTLAYIGDGNNVTHSLLIIGAILGCNVTVITPAGHEVDADIMVYAQQEAEKSGASIVASNDMNDASGADVLYTDTWLSMGDETPLSDIKDTFSAYQINQQLMIDTGAKYVMHCQPAYRDLEITSEVIDGEQSLLLQQAENRMHAQNAILVNLLT